MPTRRRLTAVLLVALLASVPASAQVSRPERPERPYRGLFGGNGADAKKVRQLDLTVSFYGGYDDNVLAGGASAGMGGGMGGGSVGLDPRFQADGEFGGATIALGYTRRSERGSIDLAGGTGYRYFPTMDRFSGFNTWGSAGFSAQLTSKTTLAATGAVYYSPYYGFNSFPGLYSPAPSGTVAINPEYALIERPAITYASTASLDQRLSPRGSFRLDYNVRYTDFRDERQPLRDIGAGGGFRYRLSRQATMRLGYHYRRASYGLYWFGRPIESHDIDAGVDYARALSISRRTTFGFSTGSSIYRMYAGDASQEYDPRYYRTRYMLIGNAYLNREIGRSWNARLDYRRGMQFVEGFPDPFFSDTVSAYLGGFAGRRTQLSFSAAYSSGEVGFLTSQGYDTSMANAHAQYALARWAALYADYFFYHYLFDAGIVLPVGMGRGLDRHGVRIGINLWAPLLR